MGDSMLERSDWLEGGFPKPASISKNQRMFINRRAHLLKLVLTKEQKVALRLMRFDFWLKSLSRSDASAIINNMRLSEEREKESRIAKRLAKRHSLMEAISENSCSICGGELDEDPVAPTCKTCGKGALRVQL